MNKSPGCGSIAQVKGMKMKSSMKGRKLNKYAKMLGKKKGY